MTREEFFALAREHGWNGHLDDALRPRIEEAIRARLTDLPRVHHADGSSRDMTVDEAVGALLEELN